MKALRIGYRRPLIAAIALIILTACLPVQPAVVAVSSPSPASTPTSADGSLQIYFTDPSDPHAADYQGGPDIYLVAAINSARISVDMAAYSFNLWSIRNALLHAHQRGVVVRLVMESTSMDNKVVQEILDAGIPVVGDNHQGLMHDKFVVIDRSEVWTGSMNFTSGGTYKDNNNLLCIRSDLAAADYTNEFEEMFKHTLFGPEKAFDTFYPKLNVAGNPVEIYFPPKDKAARRIVQLIQAAQESIHFMAYSFTSNPIGKAMIERSRAGIQVTGVMDDTMIRSNIGTEYDRFKQAGLKVGLDGNKAGLMHHKVIIIDQKIVITGSYNFTASAEDTNDENVVIIFSPAAAAKYMEEFQRIIGQATIP